MGFHKEENTKLNGHSHVKKIYFFRNGKTKNTYFYDDKYEGRIPQNIGQQTVGQIPKTNVSVAQECST